jgi:serine/threonine protein kinase
MELFQRLERMPGLTIAERIGGGAFGVVYRARHHALDVDVAVKVVDAASLDAAGVERTLREARLMARLDHPNLLRIFDAGQAQSIVYFVLELMDGGSCKGMRHLSPDRALSVAKQLLSGLQALHDARILHRDLKPANCLHRADDARVKLADLGIAADWHTAVTHHDWAGTIPFMAPELFERPPKYRPSSDLYALGITLACLFLSQDPFPLGSFDALRDWALYGTRVSLASARPDLPPALSRLVDRMMSADPASRPGSAAEALASLSAAGPIQPAILLPIAAEDATTGLAPATTQVRDETAGGAERIGPWELGEAIYSSSNWLGRVVTHVHTGKAARLVHLKPDGPIGGHSDSILSAAEQASELSHSNLVEVIDWGLAEGQAYVVTSAQGRTLEGLVDDGAPMQEHVAIAFMAELADALAYIHPEGLVYQLLDPTVTVVGGDARSALLNWPFFCVPAGSPAVDEDGKSKRFLVAAYAPPEVLAKEATTIEPSVDMYSLGATFCHLLVGKNAYFAARKQGRLPELRSHAASLTAPFVRLIARLTHPDPQQRPTAKIAEAELIRIGAALGIKMDRR